MNFGIISTYYNFNFMHVLITLKMTTCVTETCRWLLIH